MRHLQQVHKVKTIFMVILRYYLPLHSLSLSHQLYEKFIDRVSDSTTQPAFKELVLPKYRGRISTVP